MCLSVFRASCSFIFISIFFVHLHATGMYKITPDRPIHKRTHAPGLSFLLLSKAPSLCCFFCLHLMTETCCISLEEHALPPVPAFFFFLFFLHHFLSIYRSPFRWVSRNTHLPLPLKNFVFPLVLSLSPSFPPRSSVLICHLPATKATRGQSIYKRRLCFPVSSNLDATTDGSSPLHGPTGTP